MKETVKGNMQAGESGKTRVRILLLAVAAIMIVAGIYEGQPESVLQKAIHICLECIGIG